MRLANGIIIDKEKTFGVLKFSALSREVHIQNEDGTVSEEIKERTYDLKCKEQGRMIQVSIPASVPLKEFDYNAEVEIINPVADTVATATFQGADVDWYIKADDIVLKGKNCRNSEYEGTECKRRDFFHYRILTYQIMMLLTITNYTEILMNLELMKLWRSNNNVLR